MRLVGMGVDHSGQRLIEPLEEEEFARRLVEALTQNSEALRSLTAVTRQASLFRGERERKQTPDLGNPRTVGWTFLMAAEDPQRKDLIDIVRPLAEHREMPDPSSPLLLGDEGDWAGWIRDVYLGLPMSERPFYVLIVGGPNQIPFRFQSLMNVAAATGRVAFDRLQDLEAYVQKVIRLETADQPATAPTAVFFATDEGYPDPTYFSRRFMAEPLIQLAEKRGSFNVKRILGSQATKGRLRDVLAASRPALVYTASHGMADRSGVSEQQQRYNGAIVCQPPTGPQPIQERLFSAADVPMDRPFLEGALFFQFACYGYGTPAESDFRHWRLDAPSLDVDADFVAALPKRLLAHPEGPIAFIGHLDTAWLHAFDDPDNPGVQARWHPRLAPFMTAVENLLDLRPSGYAMGDLNTRYNLTNADLTDLWDGMRRKRLSLATKVQARLVDTFVTRGDAQNYLVFGDPAAQLRVADL